MAPTQETPITTGTLRERALAARAAELAEAQRLNARYQQEQERREAAEWAELRDMAAGTFGIDHDWRASDYIEGDLHLRMQTEDTAKWDSAPGLLMVAICPACGEELTTWPIGSLMELGQLIEANEPLASHRCRPQTTPGTNPDVLPFDESSAPTAMERLADALMDLLAERGIYPRYDQ